MIEMILPDIYRIEIPLPHNPLRSLNSYFIKGAERNLLIDTGFNQPECKAAMDAGRQELGFTMDDTDIFVTHIHGDHSGLVQYLARPDTRVFCDAYTAQAFSGTPSDYWNYFDQLLVQGGLTGITYIDHPGFKYKSAAVGNVHLVQDGDVIDVGRYHLRCVSTPGHSPDHMCLYAAEQGILFSGDHILSTITPNNTLWDQPWTATRDLLQEYLDSLTKIEGLDIKITLPAHRETIPDCYLRIRQLREHHQRRFQDILTIIGYEKMYGAQVASHMLWDMRGMSWEEFSPAQKIFASSEALSHLTHLVLQGILVRELIEDRVYYSLADRSVSLQVNRVCI